MFWEEKFQEIIFQKRDKEEDHRSKMIGKPPCT